MQKYRIKITYRNTEGRSSFRIGVGEGFDEEYILAAVAPSQKKIDDMEIAYASHKTAFSRTVVRLAEIIMRQQHHTVLEGICCGEINPEDYRDVRLKYNGASFHQAQFERITNTLMLYISEMSFTGEKAVKYYDMERFFQSDHQTFKQMAAYIAQNSGLLPAEEIDRRSSVLRVFREANGHLIVFDADDSLLPYYNSDVLSEKVDDVDAEWELYDCLSQQPGIATTQMILVSGFQPDETVIRAISSLTGGRNVITCADHVKTPFLKVKTHIVEEDLPSNVSQGSEHTAAQGLLA